MATTYVTIEIGATCECDFEVHDYGVPFSPVWEEVANITTSGIWIQDRLYTREELREAAGEKGANFIIGWLEDSIDHHSWE